MLTRSMAIGMAAVAAGAAHSWIQPVKLGLRDRTETPTLPDQPPPVVDQTTGAEPDTGPAVPDSDPPLGPIDPDSLGPFISLAEARSLFESGTLFIDTRLKEEFDASRILGAYHLSTREFGTPEGGEVLAMLSADTHYVLYCEGGECDTSENVAARLEDAFPRFHILRDGFPAWVAAGYEVEPEAPQ
jgi:rhodanese-related sulfurtransferase